MTPWICVACGVQQAPSPAPPAGCPICLDERQYVGWAGQRWVSPAELAADHRPEMREEEPGLVGVGIAPSFGIGQRALLVRTGAGNLLWDTTPLVDDATVAAVAELGGVAAICPSHPHFYGACVEWSAAFDGAPVWIPAADRRWLLRTSPTVHVWEGDEATPLPGLRLLRLGGHFDGSAVLHWPDGAGGRGALLVADTFQVAMDRRWVSMMWSYPNLMPVPPATFLAAVERVAHLRVERLYGGWWGRNVDADAQEVLRRSAERYAARAARRPGG